MGGPRLTLQEMASDTSVSLGACQPASQGHPEGELQARQPAPSPGWGGGGGRVARAAPWLPTEDPRARPQPPACSVAFSFPRSGGGLLPPHPRAPWHAGRGGCMCCVCTKGLNKDAGLCGFRSLSTSFPGLPSLLPLRALACGGGVFCSLCIQLTFTQSSVPAGAESQGQTPAPCTVRGGGVRWGTKVCTPREPPPRGVGVRVEGLGQTAAVEMGGGL